MPRQKKINASKRKRRLDKSLCDLSNERSSKTC